MMMTLIEESIKPAQIIVERSVKCNKKAGLAEEMSAVQG